MAKLKKKPGCGAIYNLQDLFPASLVHAGLGREQSLSVRIGNAIADRAYAGVDRVIVISDAFRRVLLSRGVPEEKIVTVHNWTDEQSVLPVARENNRLFGELGIDRDGFIVTYAGNLGHSQGIDTILEAAGLLESDGSVRFVLFGGGTSFEDYRKKIADSRATNVSLYPLQPLDRVGEVYSLGDASIVACKPGIGSSGVPSKTLSILATATPVVLSYDAGTELADLIVGGHVGVHSEAGNAAALAENIRMLSKNPDLCREMGKNARALTESRFSRQTCVGKYVDVFASVIKS